MDKFCKTCGGPVDGYKCINCDGEFESIKEDHSCGVDGFYFKCAGCGQAETECSCVDENE